LLGGEDLVQAVADVGVDDLEQVRVDLCWENMMYDLSSRGPLPLLIFPEGTELQAKYPIWYKIL
jgi:hypothetical protein